MSYEDQAKSVLDSANDTAKLVRSVHLTFMLVMAYIAVVIGSTTDVQLLKVSPVTLPLLNVQLPIVEFYILTPWLLLLLHFNLLLQSYLLARKLHVFNAAVNKCDAEVATTLRNRLFTFALSQNIVGNNHSSIMRFFLNSMIVFSIVVVPLVLLTWAQVRFIPYHSEAITWSHRLVVLLDCLLLWIIWPMIVLPEEKLRRWVVQNICWFKKLCGKAAINVAAKDRVSTYGSGQYSLMVSSIVLLFISWVVAVQPDHNEQGTKTSQFFLTDLLFNLPGKPFRQDLYIKDKILVKGEISAKIEVALKGSDEKIKYAALGEIVGLSLQGRDLRFASFEKCVMPKAMLGHARLQGAILNDTLLQESDFLDADLRGASLIRSRLLGSSLSHAQLNGAQLVFADMQLVDLAGANLQGAVLVGAKMTGSSLVGSDLQGTVLNSAILMKANLRGTNLDGATLLGANVDGAFMDKDKEAAIKARAAGK